MPIVVLDEGFLALVIALSVLSGVGTFLQGKRDKRLTGGLIDFFTEITLAVVVGLTIAHIGEGQNLDRSFTCALVLILSNNGADTLEGMRKIVSSNLNKFLRFISGDSKK